MCSSTLLEQTRGIRDRTPLVYPKGKTYGRKVDRWDAFFANADTRLRYDLLPKGRLDGRVFRTGSELVKAWRFINKNAEALIDGYVRDRWENDLRTGMEKSETYNRLHEDWLDYFRQRREEFMSRTNALIETNTEALAKKGKIPQSHGGVANLLKVLTKTMKEQGSGIENIAKMQYAICMQAGIYIIPEFLTDVLVAEGIMKGAEK